MRSESESALQPAISLARTFGSNLVLTRVVPSHFGTGHGGSVGGRIRDPEAIAYLEDHADALRAMRLPAEVLPVANNEPAEGIMAAATERANGPT